MEKHAFEAYEFLATTSNNPDADTNQFFVLQEDGTILTVNKEIQYITQVEDDKTPPPTLNPADGCVFDVSSQQYFVDVEGNTSEIISMNGKFFMPVLFVDVEGNTSEIISMNDQFAITNGENNVYTNTYLIQPEITETTQMETEAIDPETFDAQQLQQHNVEALNGNKQATDLTEITLSDEQYQVLQQKGWILMESNDKIFVLNNLGLHDITTDDKLIQKLKNELQDNIESNSTSNIGQLKIENISAIPNDSNDEIIIPDQGDMVEYLIEKNLPIQLAEPGGNVQFIINENENEEMNKPSEEKYAAEVPMSINKHLTDAEQTNSESHKRCDFIKIKTKYTFTDIPEKIFLGKTVNGKKLFAKVTKRKKGVNIIYGKKIDKKPQYSAGLNGARFTNLIQDSFRESSAASGAAVAAAGALVAQLLRLANIKNAIIGNNLVVTKITVCETDSGRQVAKPSMVTGVVKQMNGEDTFIHMPFMLDQVLDRLNESEEKLNATRNNFLFSAPSEERTAKRVIELFNIHVSETRYTDKPPQTSVNLSKRKLSLDVLNDAKKRHPNPVYACGTCGGVFNSELLLKDHQDNECLEVEDELTIDTDDFKTDNEKLYSIIQNGKEKVYSCTICEAKFSRLFNCQKHIKAHKAGVEKKLKVYKCKMCPNTYFHSSSLAKHIVKMHIQMQLK